jgi:hypothetical protein
VQGLINNQTKEFMKTRKDLIEYLKNGGKIKLATCPTHKNFNVVRGVEKVLTNQLQFDNGCWLRFEDIDIKSINEKGFSLKTAIEGIGILTYEFIN